MLQSALFARDTVGQEKRNNQCITAYSSCVKLNQRVFMLQVSPTVSQHFTPQSTYTTAMLPSSGNKPDSLTHYKLVDDVSLFTSVGYCWGKCQSCHSVQFQFDFSTEGGRKQTKQLFSHRQKTWGDSIFRLCHFYIYFNKISEYFCCFSAENVKMFFVMWLN